MSNDYPPPGPGQDPGGQSNQPPPPPPSEPQWNPQTGGTPPAGAYDAPGYGQPGYGQPGGQPPYGQQPGQPPSYPPPPPGAPGGYGQPQQTSPLAIVSLVLGILGVPCCTFFVFGVAALVTGLIARKQINESQGRLKGGGMAMAGVVLGAIAVVIAVVYYILVLTNAIDTNWDFQTTS